MGPSSMADAGQEIADKVLAYILETWGYRFETDEIDPNASLFMSGTIDSFGTLDLVVFLEETFEIAVADDDMEPENMDCITAIAAFVKRKLAV